MYKVFTVTQQLLSTGCAIQFHKPEHLFELSDFFDIKYIEKGIKHF